MKITNSLIQVAVQIMRDPTQRVWGYDLSRQARIRSGVLYPILHRMLEEGWLVDGWEELPLIDKRPPRRYYQVTTKGLRELGAVIRAGRTDRRSARPKPKLSTSRPGVIYNG